MQDQLKFLFELQKLDSEISTLQTEADAVPKQVDQLRQQIEDARGLVALKETARDSLGKTRREKERELETMESRVTKNKVKMMEVKTNKEYHALQKEIEKIHSDSSVIEEEILLLMDDIEQSEVEVKRAKSRFEKTAAEIEEKIQVHQARLDELPGELGVKQEQRKELTSKIDRELMDRYNRVKTQRDGLAVAFVEKGICQGCRLAIPPQVFNLIQRKENIYTCPNCHRILYFPGEAQVNEIEV